MAADLRLETWQDAAIRNLAQDQRSPLFIAAAADTPLDDVAARCFSLAPEDIARLGYAVAARLSAGDAPQTADLPEEVAAIASALASAKRPLVISGTGSGSAPVMAAAAQVARSLCELGRQAMLCLTVPEANSLGQAMLAGDQAPNLRTICDRAAAGEIDTLVILENDLYRRAPEVDVNRLLAGVANVIVLDGQDNRTISAASLALPAASFAETEGTLVSLEGRAQRHYPVFQPLAERRGSWVWLLACMKEMEHPEVSSLHHFDDVTRACAANIGALAGITAAAPDHHFRNAGVKIPRQPHRYSGRTAMRADVSVHEPKQPVDEESPLAFTMEGLNRSQPGALLPYVWAPGWNSNQSLHRFQDEVGGSLKGGTAGARLLQTGSTGQAAAAATPEPFRPAPGQWQLVPRHRIFGSDELSALSPGIIELVEAACIEISSADATELGVIDGDGLSLSGGLATLEVRINDRMAAGCAGYSAGHPGTENLAAGDNVSLGKAHDWNNRRAQLIGTDRGAGQGGIRD
jgi:NADH-quinone oxidoreductase subunit G